MALKQNIFKSFFSYFTKKDIFSINKPIHKATETWLALLALYRQEWQLFQYYQEAAEAVNPHLEWHYFAFLKDKYKEHLDNALLLEPKVEKAKVKHQQLQEEAKQRESQGTLIESSDKGSTNARHSS